MFGIGRNGMGLIVALSAVGATVATVFLGIGFFAPTLFPGILWFWLGSALILFIGQVLYFGLLCQKILAAEPKGDVLCRSCGHRFPEEDIGESDAQFGGIPLDGCPRCKSPELELVPHKPRQ